MLLILQAVRYPGDKDQDYANLVLQGLGVEMLHEGVFDRKRRFTAPIAAIFQPEGFFWTENIVQGHPVTAGVKCLCLPQYHNGTTPGVVALKLSPQWQVLVRGEASAQSYAVTREHVVNYQRVGTFAGAPPIAAVRSFGKGRVMAVSVPARSVHANYGVPGWNMIVETAGDRTGKRPSDGARLVLNGLRWLVETSRDNPALGAFRSENGAAVEFRKSIDWDAWNFPPPTKGVRGVLGARTALSDGTGTAAQYAAAARGAGLSFIVFNESLEKMTPEKLDRLKRECKQASTTDFYACPGVEFSDDLGNRWAIWSERIVFPPKSFQRAYGQTSEKRPELAQWDGSVMHNPGQYWEYCAYSPNMLLTYRNLRARKAHPANMWWFYRVPPFVYDRGKLVEDQFREWLYALRDVRHLNVASYTRVYAPSEVSEAASVCATGGRDLASIRDWLNTRCGNFSHPAGAYVTGGPAIEQWAAINTQHDFPAEVRGGQRARCRFQVSSAEGIREVKVHNADYGVVRRFLAGGENPFRPGIRARPRQGPRTCPRSDRSEGPQSRLGQSLSLLLQDKLAALWRQLELPRRRGTLLAPRSQRNDALGAGLSGSAGGEHSRLRHGGGAHEPNHAPCAGRGLRRNRRVEAIPARMVPRHLAEGPQRRSARQRRQDLRDDDGPAGGTIRLPDPRHAGAQRRRGGGGREPALFPRPSQLLFAEPEQHVHHLGLPPGQRGAKDYRGGMVWHEGKIIFKRPATLAGSVPIMLFYLRPAARRKRRPTRSW